MGKEACILEYMPDPPLLHRQVYALRRIEQHRPGQAYPPRLRHQKPGNHVGQGRLAGA